MFTALLVLPTLTFVVIHDFIGRMTVVALVGLGVSLAAMQSGLIIGSGSSSASATKLGPVDCLLWIGVYVGVMAVIAGSL